MRKNTLCGDLHDIQRARITRYYFTMFYKRRVARSNKERHFSSGKTSIPYQILSTGFTWILSETV